MVIVTLIKAFVRSLAVLVIVSFFTFCLMFGNGKGIARGILGIQASDADIQRKVADLGLDRPLLVQYVDWFAGVFRGDLGASFYTGQSVISVLEFRVPLTLSIIVVTFILTAALAVALGVAAAYYGGWIDRALQFVSSIGTAVPGFIVAVALVLAFAVAIPLLPATGYVAPQDSVSGWIASITLPVIALLFGSVAGAAAQIRGSVIDTLSKDFVRTLRARGMSERAIVLRHVLRNSSGPGLTALGLQILGMLGGVIFIEQVFALPGIGQLANSSAQTGDVNVVMGIVLVTILLVLIVNFVTDLANTLLNPKTRVHS